MRYFTPPQADQPEIFIMAEQEVYAGNYGGDGTKPGKINQLLKQKQRQNVLATPNKVNLLQIGHL